MACTAAVPNAPTIRPEGFTELVGDIVVTCTGGATLVNGMQIPQANLTIFVNTQVTSRILGPNGASEALLLVDNPGPTQLLCATPLTGCVAYVGTAAPNVYQGVETANSVTFYGVPILPPGSTGSRTYRITNLRVNASAISIGGPIPNAITSAIVVGPSNAFTLNQSTFVLAYDGPGPSMSATLREAAALRTGDPPHFVPDGVTSTGSPVLEGILRFQENFPGAFKIRTTGNEFTGQKFPGQAYNNTESGFTLPSLSSGSSIAGVADWGTRLKAVFTNVPSGATILVSTVNVASLTTAATAVLLTGETVAEGALAVPALSIDNVPYAPVTIANGTGIAVWEVASANDDTTRNIDFSVLIDYPLVPPASPIMVRMGYAPNPTNGAFTAAAGADPIRVNLIPRFIDTSVAIPITAPVSRRFR